MVGYYDHVPWPESVRAVAGWACACVKSRLTYDNIYTPAGQDRPDIHDLELSGHRDYTTEKTCPGTAITNDFFVRAAADGWSAYEHNQPPNKLGEYHYPGLAVYHSATRTGGIAKYLASNTTVTIDAIDAAPDYAPGTGHLADGSGFVEMAQLTKV